VAASGDQVAASADEVASDAAVGRTPTETATVGVRPAQADATSAPMPEPAVSPGEAALPAASGRSGTLDAADAVASAPDAPAGQTIPATHATSEPATAPAAAVAAPMPATQPPAHPAPPDLVGAAAPRPAPREAEPIDLLAITGAKGMARRAAPYLIVLALVVAALVVWLAVR
jgi:hypothetical protein